MKLNLNIPVITCSWMLLHFCSVHATLPFLPLSPVLHENEPRLFRIYSKPPEPDAEKHTGRDIMGHVSNVLKGGSIGIQYETRPLEKIGGFFRPLTRWLDKKPELTPLVPDQLPPEKKDESFLESEDEEKFWEPENPKNPVPEGPSWEDIGENVDYTTIPIEDIIQPRIKPKSRPRRFIESKIYHVPLLFRSNAKPYQVKIRSQNDFEEIEKSSKLI